MSANKMFEAKAKLFTKGQNVKSKHKPSIEYGDMEKLNKYFMEGQNNGIWRNPEKLVEFVWFSLCYHFARRGREGWWETPLRSGANDATRATNKQYALQKPQVICPSIWSP